ncbi:MAG: hypothetical protein JWO95_1033, partial [Verrucomicrobiales bacterium]|nr:hypothetical protein [Verrucomicrobiales bacterium]
MKQFFGKYRGTVTSNLDPLQRGRILATVPDVLGQHATGWALPCLPYAGNGVGLFFVPPIGALVWIEFERGDSDYPIWSGCIPDGVSVGSPNQKTIKTHSATIIIDDTPGAS